MNCPRCNTKSIVKDSRPSPGTWRRRRECEGCGHRFSTYEITAPDEGSAILNCDGRISYVLGAGAPLDLSDLAAVLEEYVRRKITTTLSALTGDEP